MLNDDYLIPVYKRVGPVFTKGKGSYLWDNKGKKYLDLFPGWGVGILGHCHPDIAKVIAQQAKQLIHIPNNLYHKWQGALAKEIVKSSFPSKVFFANSGAEAIEGALKYSRLYGQHKRYEVITMRDSFHGRTFGALSATGQLKYQEPFKPILPGFRQVELNNFEDFKRKVSRKTVAVMLELIQGEGGVNGVDVSYIQKVVDFCARYDILVIIDEVQTGMGRTGKLFCFQHYGFKPDIFVLSKGLGAGFPISAFVVKKSISDYMKPGHHASTFGGGPLAARVSLETFKIIKRDKLLKNAQKMGQYLLDALSEMKKEFNIIKEVRGLGLMTGVELTSQAQPLFMSAFKKGLIINATHENVLRIMPALTVNKKEIDAGLKILKELFQTHSDS